MDQFHRTDVEQIAQLLARAGDPTVDISIPDRKSFLVAGLAQLIQADIWNWVVAVSSTEIRGNVMATSYIDGGWSSDLERAEFYQVLTDPAVAYPMQAVMTDSIRAGQFRTFVRQEIVPDDQWLELGTRWRAKGFGHSIVTVYPLGENASSGIGFHRRIDKPDFTERDRAIAHLVFQQVDWLHRYGSSVPASKTVLQLSPRERQVLIFLLSGKSRKEIANAMQLSEFTIGDYIKQLHKRFSVNSRTELLAHFISGGRRP